MHAALDRLTQAVSMSSSVLKTAQARKVFALSRWLHIYISTALFSLLLFFCITGITLNHPSWSNDSNEQVKVEFFSLPQSIVTAIANEDELPLRKIETFIQDKTHLSNPRSVDILLDDGEINFDYAIPAGYAYAIVSIETGEIELEYKTGGIIALMNDLHKGRHSGEVWSWVIDLSAVLMLLFSLTGFIIVFQNNKHRNKALVTIAIGLVTPVAIYLLLVPKLIL